MKKFLIRKKIHNKTENKGFTLVETLFAIFILVISTTGPMAVAQSSLKASFIARDQTAAFYLAQDVIELIKNSRDTIYFNNLEQSVNDSWINDAFEACFNETSTPECQIDTRAIPVTTVSTVDCTSNEESCRLYYDSDENIFTYERRGNTSTKFKRFVYLKKIQNNNNDYDELEIRVKVTWDTSSFLVNTREIWVQENIYNWLKYD